MTAADQHPDATTAARAAALANEVQADPDTRSGALFAKRLVAETFGTFLLVVVDCGGAVIGSMNGEVTAFARSAATGLLVMVMIYSIGNVSGAHFNPAVTTAFALRGMEIILTLILVSVVLGTATRHRSIGPNAAIASGGAVALCSLFSRPISGASMNPARSLAPAVVSGELHDLWIYLVAPFVGAALATLIMRILHSHKHKSEREAAQGR